MTSFYHRLLQRLAFSESRHFSWDKDPARTMAYCTITQITSNTSYTFEAVNGVNHDHDKIKVDDRVTFSDKQDDEIYSESPVTSHSRSNDSNGLRCSAERAVSSQREVFFHSRISFKQIKRSSKHACLVLFLSFCATGAALNGGVHFSPVLASVDTWTIHKNKII